MSETSRAIQFAFSIYCTRANFGTSTASSRVILIRAAASISACIWLAVVLIDAFNTIVLARRTDRSFRLTRWFYRATWTCHTAIARQIRDGRRREDFLSIYGPLSLIALMACWGISLLLVFAVLQWSAGLKVSDGSPGFGYALYFSGASLVTIVPGSPANTVSRILTVLECGIGISLLGLVVGYLPVLYQSFSSRELHISMLDARAGSPPSAGMLLARGGGSPDRLEDDLARWEEWAAEILESHLSYPMLAYFRSQHLNQSWLSAITATLDVSALVAVCSRDDLRRQAMLTFAMGRHAVVDLARLFGREPREDSRPRLKDEDAQRLQQTLQRERVAVDAACFSREKLEKLVAMYEPYVDALGQYFLIALPAWMPDGKHRENWRAAAWDRTDETFSVSDPFSEYD